VEAQMKGAEESVLERPEAPRKEAARSPSTIKSVLFHVHEDEQFECRLQTALAIARCCSAHLECLHVIPVEPFAVVDAFSTFVNAQTLAMLEEQGAKQRERIEARLAAEDVAWSYTTTSEALIPEIVRSAALSDLLIIGRQPEDPAFGRSARSLLGEIICNSRTPLCIPGTDAEPLNPFGTVVIAWNGSIEAANAIRQSIGLTKMASNVRVVRFTEDKEAAFPDTRVLEYLSHHGVHAQLDTRAVRHDVVQDLSEYAAVAGASYIIMGGYSHSRAGEFLFGGVTRSLLREFPISLVMAH
jgi:nucleotide-binding universal stress UspA family protein